MKKPRKSKKPRKVKKRTKAKKQSKARSHRKAKRQSRAKKGTFYDVVTGLIESIERKKNELRTLKNEELKKLNINEEEQIKLIRNKIEVQRQKLIERYEKKKGELGKALLMKKKEKLGKQLTIERRTLNRTKREINKAKKDQKKLKR